MSCLEDLEPDRPDHGGDNVVGDRVDHLARHQHPDWQHSAAPYSYIDDLLLSSYEDHLGSDHEISLARPSLNTSNIPGFSLAMSDWTVSTRLAE